MELRHLRYFLTVAREGNFARAARRAAVAPSTLYRRLNDLEQELKTSLFDHEGGDVRLSTAGALFAAHAARIVEEADQLSENMGILATGREGLVRIGTNGVAAELPVVSEALTRVRKRLPQTGIRLVALQSQEQIDRVRAGRLDLGLVYTRRDQDGLGHAPVQRQRFVLVLARQHRLANVEGLRLADLAGEDFLFQVRGARGSMHDRLIAACQAGGLVPRISHYIVDEDTQLAMVAAGMGISLTLEGAASRRWHEQLVFKELADLDVRVTLDLIWNDDRLSDQARRVADLIIETGKANLHD